MQPSFPPVLPLRTPAQVARQAAYHANEHDPDVEREAWKRCTSRKHTVQFFRERDAVLRERGIRSSKKLHPGVLRYLEQQQQGPPLGHVLAQMPWPRDLQPDRAVLTVIAAVARMYGVFYIICTLQQARGLVADAHKVAASAEAAGSEGSQRLAAWLPEAEAAAEQPDEDDDDVQQQEEEEYIPRSSEQQAEDRAARMAKRRRLSEEEQQPQQQPQGKRGRQREQLPTAVVFHGTLASAALACFQQLLARHAGHVADLARFSYGMRMESLAWHVPQLGHRDPPPFQVLTVPIVHTSGMATHMLQSDLERFAPGIEARFRSRVTPEAAAAIRPGQSKAQQQQLTEYDSTDYWDKDEQLQQDASYAAGQQVVRSMGVAQWAWLKQQGEEEQQEEEEDERTDEAASMQELLLQQQQAVEAMAAVQQRAGTRQVQAAAAQAEAAM